MGAADRSIAREELTRLLSSALGQEKSEEVVVHAAAALGMPGGFFAADEVRELFRYLSTVEGLIGVVARFAVSRGEVEDVVTRSSGGPASAPDATPATTTAEELVHLLAPALGVEKARDATFAMVAHLRYDPYRLAHEEAVLVLDELAKTPGIVGVVSRFAKARFLLARG